MDYSIYIIVWVACGIVSLLIARSRDATNGVTWFVVGLVFGPIGVILALIGARAPKLKRADAMETLRGLADLRAKGTITDAEYEAKKGELLAKV